MAFKAHILAFPNRNALTAAEPSVVQTREVTIASGLHAGATFSVQEGDLTIIGADAGCDICLGDAGIAPRHAVMTLHQSDVLIRGLDGAVGINGEQLRATKRVSADQPIVITLGTDEVRLEIAATVTATQTTASRPAAPPAKPTIKRRAITLLCISLFAVIATALVAQKLDASLAAKPGKPDIAAVQALLEQQGLAKVLSVCWIANPRRNFAAPLLDRGSPSWIWSSPRKTWSSKCATCFVLRVMTRESCTRQAHACRSTISTRPTNA
jgi:hypothetical protein